ncbi:MAG: aminoglycoside 3'-phosphotransferase [Acidobacteriota bacterium]|nr:aminoglycoside 3'-phosphotransferase [Acidobacteriota bacterium]
MNAEILRKSLPANLAQAVSGYAWRQIHVGCSIAQVFRLEAGNKKSLYLKIAARLSGNSLGPEKLKLDWLQNQLFVPKVVLFVEDENTDYLLLSEIFGVDASDNSLSKNAADVIEQLANGLKMIYSLPTENCPFNARLDYKIELAKERMLKGLVDESDFDDERAGRCAEDLFQELLATKPSEEDLVFTHGDYCLPNIILENGKLSGIVDWGNAGVADRYQDLALLTRSVSYNFGKEWEERVFEIYGIEPDWKKIHFYRLLDEFF